MESVTLDWLDLVALLGALQGLLLAGVLAARRRNRTANRLLAVAMLAFSIHLASTAYYSAGLVTRFPHFFGVGYPLTLLYGPLIYLYAQTAADRDRRLAARDALHLLPFALVVLAGSWIWLLSGEAKVALYQAIIRGERPPLIRLIDPLKYVSGISYALLTLRFLGRHRERIKESYSSVERVNLRWLLWLGLGATAVWLLALGFQLLESVGIERVARQDDYVSLAIAALVYAIGYMGLRQPEIFRYETAEYPIPEGAATVAASPAVEAPAVAAGASDEPARYERSGLTPDEADRLKQSLTTVMTQEQPWLDSELTLADLATRLGTTPHKLSEVLNTAVGETFYDFVNGYRVREVQRRLAAGEGKRLTILALALEAGFATKSTFNLVFKKHTGKTPSEYRQTAGG
ncbi:MAG: helix-turn-helix domain-containing protein [Gemmatimonadales bacterium]